jgi:hypothetical protein
VLSKNVVVCTTPPTLLALVALVEVNMDGGLSYSADGVQFTFYKEPFLVKVMPSYAGAAGGSSVTFVGKNFADSSDVSCRFELKSVARSM